MSTSIKSCPSHSRSQTYVQLVDTAFLTGRFGSLHYLLLRSLRANFTRLEDILGQVETGICKREHGGMRRATHLRTCVTARSMSSGWNPGQVVHVALNMWESLEISKDREVPKEVSHALQTHQ